MIEELFMRMISSNIGIELLVQEIKKEVSRRSDI